MESERILCVKPQVFVYKIPSRSTNKAPRAAEWDLTNPNWEGVLKIIEVGKKLRLDLVDKTGALFGSCPIETHPGPAVEGVSDSSRYFVIKLVNENGKHAFIGIGFTERNDSFDFNCTIHDFFSKDARLEAMRKEFQKGPAVDLRLKAGQKLNFDISGLVNRNTNPNPSKATTQRVSSKNTKICTVLMPDETGDVSVSNSSQNSTTPANSANDLLPSDLFSSAPLSNPFDSKNESTNNFVSNPGSQNDLSFLFNQPTSTPYDQNYGNPSGNLFASSGGLPIQQQQQQQPTHNIFSNGPTALGSDMGFMNDTNQHYQTNSIFNNNAVNANPSFVTPQPMHQRPPTKNDPFSSFAPNEMGGFALPNSTSQLDSDIFNFDTPNKNNQLNQNNFQDPFF